MARDPLLAPLTPLAQDVRVEDVDVAYQTLKNQAPAEKLADLAAVLYILGRRKNMQISSSLQQELRQIARTSPGFADLYHDLLVEGKAEGKAEGKVEGIQNSILSYLKHRFPQTSWDIKLLEAVPSENLAELQEQLWDAKDAQSAQRIVQKVKK